MSEPLPIRIPVWRWASLIGDLRRRGGRGESGAFLLGRHDLASARVCAHACYDDLDPDAYQYGAIVFHAVGHAALSQYCRRTGLQVLADVHTHPGSDVRQSPIDQRHPMIPIVGHTALIVPNYAHTSCWSLNGIGVHEYLGNFKWRSFSARQRAARLRLSLW